MATVPHLNRMRISLFMQGNIGLGKLARNPSALLRAAQIGASLDNRAERSVGSDRPLIVAIFLPQGFRKRPTDLQPIGHQHHSRIRRPPKHRLALVIPRENAVAIGA